ncbi:DNA mismatch repair protein MutL, partial [Corynespora cassiicola Philippines]
MATIKPIEGRSVHQIQSGQVIVDLQSVCKELVENSIDAGATAIDVRFKNSGLDSIEVQDNGAGISPDDFETIALKHYTSKLSTYDDLSSLETFGFRGEALSSLCALSKFHIVTARAEDGPRGKKLEFEQSGKLKGTSVVAAKQGTTVVVESLFYNLPVRRKELEKTIKREYNKVLALLNAYACISTGIKFSVSNQLPKGKKAVAFATNANPNTKENIANVYGAKTLSALIPLDLVFEMDASNRPRATQSARNWGTQEDDGSRTVKIVGHISRPIVGEGRQTPDRQMFFVNSRPCGLPQVAKAFNEVYKTYNITQSPFVFADIKLDTNAYDVNVSPDKRTILLHDQTALLESLKNSLVELFDGQDQRMPQTQLTNKKQNTLPSFKPLSITPHESTGSKLDEPSDEEASPPPQAEPATDRNQSLSPEQSTDSSKPQAGFIKASLIERFAERDSAERVVSRSNVRKRSHSQDKEIAPKAKLSHSSVRSDSGDSVEEEKEEEREDEREEAPAVRQREELSPLFEPEQDESAKSVVDDQPSRIVQDFNARIASQHAKELSRRRSSKSPGSDVEVEEDIPAIQQTSQRLTQSTIQTAFDRTRPMRIPIQKATITVGDTTTETTVGSQSRSAKRARIHEPKSQLIGTALDQTPKKPLLMRSLRGFAAPGTQVEESDDEVDGEDREPESSMPDAPVDSPTSRKLRSQDGIAADDVYESSSVVSLPAVSEQEPSVDVPEDADGLDVDYVDESEKKAIEEEKVAKMIAEAEEAAAMPTEDNMKRASKLFKASNKKYSTLNFERTIKSDVASVTRHIESLAELQEASISDATATANLLSATQLNNEDHEERLTLTVTKADFSKMVIIGQFNLGFILAVRPPTPTTPTSDLFIIDQHASDEKFNFERFSSSTVLESQRLVQPHPLELTAVEEEIILNNAHALTANGFGIKLDTSGDTPVGRRSQLVSLPMAKGVTFTPTDLEELLALLLDDPPSSALSTTMHVPRPSKVRKLLASRACRSSVMVGKTLRKTQMEGIVRHMGSMDKPWSCPHGRPTMRHLFGLENWEGWGEGDGLLGMGETQAKVDWGAWAKAHG